MPSTSIRHATLVRGAGLLLRAFAFLIASSSFTPTFGQTEWIFPNSAIPTAWNQHVLVADLNGDGRVDVVSAGTGPDTANVYLGRPDGTFGPATTFSGSEGADLAADLTNDGIPDLVGSSELQINDLVVLPSVEPGVFGPGVSSSLKVADQHTLRAGDLDLDGSLDLVELPEGGGGCKCLRILLGHGDGTVDDTEPVLPVASNHRGLQLDDFDGDGHLDILVCIHVNTGAPQAWLYHGDGSGGFAPPQITNLPVAVDATATADLDLDGDLDFAGAGLAPDGFATAILVKNDASPFQVAGTVPLGMDSLAPTVGAACLTDVDGDGYVDGLFSAQDFSTTDPCISFARGAGPFTFNDGIAWHGRGGSYSGKPVGFADMNGDSVIDAYFTDFFFGVWVVQGRKDGSFVVQQSVKLALPSEDVAVSDCNGDGLPDVATLTAAYLPAVEVRSGLGDGNLSGDAAITQLPLGNEMIVTDVDGDGRSDVVAWSDSVNPGLVIAAGLGNGHFGTPTILDGGDTYVGNTRDAIVGDFDGDGLLDIVSSRTDLSSVELRRGLGNAQFGSPQITGVGEDVGTLASGDMAAIGVLDVLVTRRDAAKLDLLDAPGGGPPVLIGSVPTAKGPQAIAVADVDGDGDLDVTTACFVITPFADGPASISSNGYVITRYLSTTVAMSPGEFDGPIIEPNPVTADEIACVDLDHDGRQDVIELSAEPGTVLSWLSEKQFAIGHRGVGSDIDTFVPGGTGVQPSGFALGDLDGNGEIDLVVAHEGESRLDIDLNLTPTWSTLGQALPSSAGVPLLAGTGDPSPAQRVTVTASLVPPPALGLLFVGLHAPFKSFAGGVLVPSSDVVVPISPDLPLSQAWPAGLPAGTPVYLQAWFQSTATGELSASNALVTLAQ